MSNGICDAFIAKISGEQGIDNKARYLLEDFFYEEGWASKTNASAMKEGFHQQFTYNKSRIAHFIEDFVRLFKEEFKTECKKHEDAFSEQSEVKK